MPEEKSYGVTEVMASFAVETSFDDLPEDVIKECKRLILDTIGCALGGYTTDIGRITLSIARDLGGKSESTVVGSRNKTSCTNAAFVNAKMGNALDSDDVFYNFSHFASPTLFSALALGERAGVTGKDLITAFALGYDVAARVGLSRILPEGVRGGLINWIVPGSVVAAAKILRLDVDKMLHAIGIGCAYAPVTCAWKSVAPPASMVKYADMGLIGFIGVMASLLAQKGYTASTSVFEGDQGFWRFCEAVDCKYDVMVEKLGESWYIMDSSLKPYPCCRWVHIPLDLFIAIIDKHNLSPEEIEEVTVRVNPYIFGLASDVAPKDGPSAQFSIPYNISLAAFRVKPSPEWQSPKLLNDPKVKEFAKKVKLDKDPKIGEILALPEQPTFGFKRSSASIEVRARWGKISDRAEYAKGDPWKPETRMTDRALKDKFKAFASTVLEDSIHGRKKIDEIIEKVYNLETVKDLAELTKLLSPSPR